MKMSFIVQKWMALKCKLLSKMLTGQQVSINGGKEIDTRIYAYACICNTINLISEWLAAIYFNGKIHFEKFYLWMW